MQQLVLLVKKMEDSLGQINPCHGLKVRPSSRHTLVSQTTKFSCQVLRHSCNLEHFVDDDDDHQKFNRTQL